MCKEELEPLRACWIHHDLPCDEPEETPVPEEKPANVEFGLKPKTEGERRWWKQTPITMYYKTHDSGDVMINKKIKLIFVIFRVQR